MMDAEFTKYLATLGIGGVLAAFMFTFYRKDVKQFTGLWESMANQLMTVVKENTVSNTKLVTMVESFERNSLCKDDIQHMIDKTINGGKNG